MLNDFQIGLIEKDIQSSGVYMKDLVYDMLDHICCSVEDKMQTGEVFDKAYEKTKSEFCKIDYDEIQAETKFLLTINSNKMKRLKNVLGITAFILLLTGNFFKIQHWPGGGMILVLGTLLIIGILISMFRAKYLEEPTKQVKILRSLGLLSGILLITSLCFFMMAWPGATAIFSTALIIMGFGMVPLLIKNFNAFAKQINGKAAGIGLAFLVVLLFALKTHGFSQNFYESIINPDDHVSLQEHRIRTQNLSLRQKREDVVFTKIDNIRKTVNETKTNYLQAAKKQDQVSTDLANVRSTVESSVWKFTFNKAPVKLHGSIKELEKDIQQIGIKDFSLISLGQAEWEKEYFENKVVFGVFMYLDHLLLEISRIEREVLLYH